MTNNPVPTYCAVVYLALYTALHNLSPKSKIVIKFL